MDELDQFYFKRFSEDKQNQIQQLISYCSLLGLNGKDLVSIGNRLETIRKKTIRENNKKIAENYRYKIVSITGSSWTPKICYKHDNGNLYFIELNTDYPYGDKAHITNKTTNKRKEIYLKEYYCGSGKQAKIDELLLNILNGDLVLEKF